MNLNINDYFDEELKNTPFADGAEETMQHLVWYDMFLTAAMYKDADMEGIREALKKGSEYLGSRAASTAGKDITALYGIGLSLAAEEYGLYGFGFFCLLMAAAQETDSHYSSVYTLFEGGEFEGGGLSIALAARLYSMYAGADEIRFGIYACSPEESSFTAVFSDMKITECAWKAHDGQQPDKS